MRFPLGCCTAGLETQQLRDTVGPCVRQACSATESINVEKRETQARASITLARSRLRRVGHNRRAADNAVGSLRGAIPMERLAIDGGKPVIDRLPTRRLIGAAERAAVLAVLDKAIADGGAVEYGGPQEAAYCERFAADLGGGYADAVNSGTSAIYICLRALGVEPFSEVVVPAITDAGGIMPVPLCGCIPVVADTVSGEFNCGLEQIEACVGPLTSAIIVAHIAGEAAAIGPIAEFAASRGIPLIEDCAQAHAVSADGRPVGSFGALAAFSTMWGKHHSTGGQGGVVFTRDAELFDEVRTLADRGKPLGATMPPGRNSVASLNFNQDELAAAIGLAQLERLPEIATRRREFVDDLVGRLASSPSVEPPRPGANSTPSYWLLRLRYRGAGGWEKERFAAALAAEGVPVTATYAALPHTYRWFRERRVFGGSSGFPWTSAEYKGDADRQFPCPNATAAIAEHMMLQVSESWGSTEAELIAAAFSKVDAAARA
jgi:perosamine synthetase